MLLFEAIEDDKRAGIVVPVSDSLNDIMKSTQGNYPVHHKRFLFGG